MAVPRYSSIIALVWNGFAISDITTHHKVYFIYAILMNLFLSILPLHVNTVPVVAVYSSNRTLLDTDTDNMNTFCNDIAFIRISTSQMFGLTINK